MAMTLKRDGHIATGEEQAPLPGLFVACLPEGCSEQRLPLCAPLLPLPLQLPKTLQGPQVAVGLA